MSFLNAEEPNVVDLIVDFGLEVVWHPSLGLELGENATKIFWDIARGDRPLDIFVFEGTVIEKDGYDRFADREMKLPDHHFRGFPALWNVVALYLFVFDLPPWVNAGIIVVFCALMFLPTPFLHPMRVVRLRALSIAFTCLWFGSAALAVTEGLNNIDMFAKSGLLVSAAYFLLVPWLIRRRAAS
jgi:hypothetical protein